MATIEQVAIDTVFRLWGKKANYTAPEGGAPQPCKVLVDRVDPYVRAEDGTPPAGQVTLEIRVREVAAPKAGGHVAIVGGKIYRIANRPQPNDPEGYVAIMWGE